MRVIISLIVFCLVAINGYAVQVDHTQTKVLRYALNYGNSINYLGQGWGETIASIVFQETKAGYHKYQKYGVIVGDRNSTNGNKSLGVMQVQLPAARDVQRWYPHVFIEKFGRTNPSDIELIYCLLSDYKFNVRVGSWYFIKMLELSDNNWRKAILAYNRGANSNGVDVNDYVEKVLHWRKEIVLKMED